jgi:uncharacterized protein
MVWWCVVFFAITFIGITKSGFGSGVGLMIVPMTAIAMGHIPGWGSEAALGLLLPLLIAGDLIAVWQYYRLFFPETEPVKAELAPAFSLSPPPPVIRPSALRLRLEEGRTGEGAFSTASNALTPRPSNLHLQARAVITKLLPGTIVGVILGGLLLELIHSRSGLVGALIRIEIGCESIILVGIHWWRLYRGVQQRLMREPWRSHLTGGFSAISSTLAHAAGPIIAMYLLPLQLDRQLYVGTCAVYFFLLNTAKLPAYYASGQFAHAQISFTLRFLPLVVAGAFFGRWLNKRLSDHLFTKIVYVVTFALGWYILADGILRLFGKQIG